MERSPRLLTSCGHSICEKCVGSLFKSCAIMCPECGHCNIASAATSFPRNIALINLHKSTTMTSCPTVPMFSPVYSDRSHSPVRRQLNTIALNEQQHSRFFDSGKSSSIFTSATNYSTNSNSNSGKVKAVCEKHCKRFEGKQ